MQAWAARFPKSLSVTGIVICSIALLMGINPIGCIVGLIVSIMTLVINANAETAGK